VLKALPLLATAACGCHRLYWLVLVLKKVLCPYAIGAVALIHQEDTTDSMECALVLHRHWPPDDVQRTTVP
jgi:hypothetical protein